MSERETTRRTREGYDAFAEEYYELFKDSLREHPLDRAVMGVFAEMVRDGGNLKVADLGCGPGHVTAYLRELGLAPFGIDLAPEMVALAGRIHPEIEYRQGDMTALDLPDGGLGGVYSRSSIIHTPPERIGEVFAEFARVLAPGGHLLLGFQAHEDTSQLAWPFDHKVAPAYRWSVGRVADLLRQNGLEEISRSIEAPWKDPVRGFHYACILALKPR